MGGLTRRVGVGGIGAGGEVGGSAGGDFTRGDLAGGVRAAGEAAVSGSPAELIASRDVRGFNCDNPKRAGAADPLVFAKAGRAGGPGVSGSASFGTVGSAGSPSSGAVWRLLSRIWALVAFRSWASRVSGSLGHTITVSRPRDDTFRRTGVPGSKPGASTISEPIKSSTPCPVTRVVRGRRSPRGQPRRRFMDWLPSTGSILSVVPGGRSQTPFSLMTALPPRGSAGSGTISTSSTFNATLSTYALGDNLHEGGFDRPASSLRRHLNLRSPLGSVARRFTPAMGHALDVQWGLETRLLRKLSSVQDRSELFAPVVTAM